MRILLDTDALIWWMEDKPMLGSRARALLANPANIVLGSVVSMWEITMKWRTGKHPLPGSPYGEFLAAQGIALLPVTADHIAAVERLAFDHRDPFDHLILAQAAAENAVVMTSDAAMATYGIRCLPV